MRSRLNRDGDNYLRRKGWSVVSGQTHDTYVVDDIALQWLPHNWYLETGVVTYINLLNRLAEWYEAVLTYPVAGTY